jgi:hypothetical protein
MFRHETEPLPVATTAPAVRLISVSKLYGSGANAVTALLVTHDPGSDSFADRVIFPADRRLAGSLEEPSPDAITERMAYLREW